jgi:CRISPR-associated protein Csm2
MSNHKNQKNNQQSHSNKKGNYESSEKNEFYWKNDWKDEWITKEIDNDTIEFAKKYAKIMADEKVGLSTNQIRNFFTEVVKIKTSGIEKNVIDFLLLKPRIAYAAKKNKSLGIELFKKIFTHSIDLVYKEKDNKEELSKRFNNFHALFESILAYHKAFGGKTN